MILHHLRFEQFLPISIDEAWEYFSRPENLNDLTPDDMQFQILTTDIPRMHPGQIIQYIVSPFPFFRSGWVTEITHVEDKRLFVDEQRFGPFSFWHHQHHFKEMDGGVLMKDVLHYRVPLGIVGKLVNVLFVKAKVNAIFEYRNQMLMNKFGVGALQD